MIHRAMQKSQRKPDVIEEGKIHWTSASLTVPRVTLKPEKKPSTKHEEQSSTSPSFTDITPRAMRKMQREPHVKEEGKINWKTVSPTDSKPRVTMKPEPDEPSTKHEGEQASTSASFTDITPRTMQKLQRKPHVIEEGEITWNNVTPTDSKPRVAPKPERKPSTKHEEEQASTSASFTELETRNPRVVLIYTAFFDFYPWKGLEDTQKFNQFQGKPCRVQNCLVSYKKEDFSSSDVVIFHGRNLPNANTLRELHNKRPPNQAWVFFLLESPAHSPDTTQYDGLFNWTMTYRRDSDVYFPYGFYVPLEVDDAKPELFTDYLLGKDKLVVWTVSNCAGKRFSYVNKLKQFVKVDIFGGCGSNNCPHRAGLPTEDCSKLLRSYKFQLAFENTECLDYVTEKYWGSPLENGIVPIVMGGADYKEIAIPGSYINVLDYPSVKALADYLLYLDKNNTAYNEYFRWKAKYKLSGVLRGGHLNRHYHWTCDLCALANNASVKSKVYEHLDDFWSGEQCHRFSEQFDQIINQ